MNKTLVILIIIIMHIELIFSKMNSPEDFINIKNGDNKIKDVSPFIIPLHFFVRFYQVCISPIKQDNCQMYPSCSHYS